MLGQKGGGGHSCCAQRSRHAGAPCKPAPQPTCLDAGIHHCARRPCRLFADGNRYHPGFMLLDPYATRAVPVLLPENAHAAAPRMAPQTDLPVVLGSLSALAVPSFDWQVS